MSANTKECSVVVDTQIKLPSSIQHHQLVYVCDIEMGPDVQTLEESALSVPIIGNQPVTIICVDKENNKMKLIMKMKL